MCGIIGYTGKKEALPILLEGLHQLEYRGYDSAGIAISEGSAVRVLKSQGKLSNLEKAISATSQLTGICGIGHTRWATHGEPSQRNAHPHQCGQVTLVHNGIVENDQEIRLFLQQKGYTFQSETDSELIACLISYFLDQNRLFDGEAAIRQALRQIRGSYALGILFEQEPNRIYAIRKDSPLVLGLGDGEYWIASDIPALLPYTRQYLLPEPDDLLILEPGKFSIKDISGNSPSRPIITADWELSTAQKGGYPYFMRKEIQEQPAVLRKTILPRLQSNRIIFEIDPIFSKNLTTVRTIHIVACGTAMHAGMIGKQLIEKLARVPVQVWPASEFRYQNAILFPDDLVILVSQSGETADTLAALRLAKEQKIPNLAIVNVVGSSISREADQVLYTHGGPEISVASTKAYSVQLAMFYLLAIRLGELKKALSPQQASHLTKQLLHVIGLLESHLGQDGGLAWETALKKIAEEYFSCENLFYIGRGLDYALALEGSLKLKEISYIHSEACAAGELKHGPISLITPGVPVVAVATSKALLPKIISNLREVKSRGAKVFLLSQQGFSIPKDTADHTFLLPPAPDLFAPLLAVPALQLFAYHMAALRGCEIDQPRNLAKSVTVE